MSAFDQDFIDLVHASVVDREAAMFLIGIAVGWAIAHKVRNFLTGFVKS